MQWHIGPFRLDQDNTCLWRGDERLGLRPKTYDVLVYLVEHAGALVTKDELFAAVWPDSVVSESTLTASISELRKVLGETAREPQFIATVHRRGYRFIAPVTAIGQPHGPQEAPAESTPPEDHAGGTPAVTPQPPVGMVGRQTELAHLQQWWATARQGTRQIGFLTGEAGIGKTTLVDALVVQIGHAEDVWIGRGQCIEQRGIGEPYLPLLEALGRLGHGPTGPQLIAVLRRHAPSWLLHLPAFIPDAEIETVRRRASGTTRERMLRELAEAMETLTAERPLLLVLEDLHWSDVSTVEWVAYMARRRDPARLLLLGTYRSVEAVVHEHPVRRVAQELQRQGQGTELALAYWSAADVAAYLTQRFTRTALPDGLARTLYHRTNGNPLFVATLVDAWVQQAGLQEGTPAWNASGDVAGSLVQIPESIRQLLEWQLDQLDPATQAILEAASVVGKAFATAAVTSATGQTLEDVEDALTLLARRGQVVCVTGLAEWPDGKVSGQFSFLHDLYRETVYARLAATRRLRLHRHIGACLEASYGAHVGRIAAELALHFVQGRDAPQAVRYLVTAGEQALHRYAYHEASTHFTDAVHQLPRVPDTPARVQHAIKAYMGLGLAWSITRGYAAPEVEEAYAQARELCQQLEEVEALFLVLYGLWSTHVSRAELRVASALAEQIFALSQRTADGGMRMQGHIILGQTQSFRGEFASSHSQVEHALALYDCPQHHGLLLQYGEDPCVLGHFFAAWNLWFLGYPEQAMQHVHAMQTLAHSLDHPFSVAGSLYYGSFIWICRREWAVVQAWTSRLTEMGGTHDFPQWLTGGMVQHGWAVSVQGRPAEGIVQMREGMRAFREIGAGLSYPMFLGALAAAYGHVGQRQRGLRALREAVERMEKTWERRWEAEIYRLQGELLLGGGARDTSQAEASLQHALEVARHQQARSLELRATMSLCRLWQRQGQARQARHVLSEICAWFTEGFDTADLQEAKGLLEELGT